MQMVSEFSLNVSFVVTNFLTFLPAQITVTYSSLPMLNAAEITASV